MILDDKLEFCDATAVNAAAGTANVGDQLDLGPLTNRRINPDTLKLVINVSAAFTSGGSATVQFRLVSDGVTTPATDGTETVHWASDVFAVADLPVGRQIIVPLPAGHPPYERYLGLQVVTAVATTTAGSINAFLVNDADNWAPLADAVN